MKEELFPKLIEAHKTLVKSYEYLQVVDGWDEDEYDKLIGDCPLCVAVGRTWDDKGPCDICTYQGVSNCIFPNGVEGAYDNPYFEEHALLEEQAYYPDGDFPLESVLEAKIALHKEFLSIYSLWENKTIDAEETALRLKVVYDEYVEEHK